MSYPKITNEIREELNSINRPINWDKIVINTSIFFQNNHVKDIIDLFELGSQKYRNILFELTCIKCNRNFIKYILDKYGHDIDFDSISVQISLCSKSYLPDMIENYLCIQNRNCDLKLKRVPKNLRFPHRVFYKNYFLFIIFQMIDLIFGINLSSL